MKVQYFSDIHLEHGEFKMATTDADVIVVAGDMGVGLSGLNWLLKNVQDRPVVYVAGNHEFYGKRVMSELYAELKEKSKGTNVHFLQNESVEIAGVTFVGATLWTDFNLTGNVHLRQYTAKQLMNDYHQIMVASKVPLYANYLLKEHEESVGAISSLLNKNGRNVVVTHHSPTGTTLHPRYVGDIRNDYYASRLEPFILARPYISHWVHGHTHHEMTIDIGHCKVYCNPRGYVGIEEVDFESGRTFEI